MLGLANVLWILSFSLLTSTWPVLASDLKTDEEVLLFRTVASADPAADTWGIPVKGWVFEPISSSFTRKLLIRALIKVLRLSPDAESSALFRSRAELFLADSERRKEITVQIGAGIHSLPVSGSDGLIQGILEVSPSSLPVETPQWVRFVVKPPPGDNRRIEGQLQLVPPTGLGVISDIDDTIKVTVVLDRREMLRNTFLRPFQAVPGMAEAYERLAQAGATFHYVSGSPWQLYPSLVQFMDEAGFPAGGFHLRSIWKRSSGEAPELSGPASHKIPTIQGILSQHLGRTFILVGDSGEKDPEIYGEIARRHPTRIRAIHIRRAPRADERPERYEAAFRGLPGSLWSVFTEPLILDENGRTASGTSQTGK